MVEDATWDELIKVCAKVDVDITIEKDENEKTKEVSVELFLEEDAQLAGTYEKDEDDEQEEEETTEEIVAKAQGLHQTLDIIFQEYKGQLNEQ
jgi:hypothetical protein